MSCNLHQLRPRPRNRVGKDRRRAPRPAAPGPRPSSGVALVITLVLLAVITFMAVTFLLVSHSEKGQVTMQMEQTTAGLAADQAFERAKADIISRMLAFTNPYSFGLLVSTSYVNGAGFTTGVGAATNVNYTYANGTPLNTLADLYQNLNNMVYDPPAPVFVPTNRTG